MLTDRQKRLLIKYFEAIEAYEYYEKRDRAMFLLMLKHNLKPFEITGLSMKDFSDGVLKTGDGTIDLELPEILSLREYLRERERAPGRAGQMLFTDSRGEILTEGKLEDAVKFYIGLLEGGT